MSKGKSYFSRLKKSTKITVISCGIFVGLTMVILLFFVMNPITPSEKVIAGFGRENISRHNSQSTEITTTAVTTTAMEDVIVSKATETTTTVSTTHTDFTITVTSGSGFYVDNVIPTGVSPYEAGSVPTTETEYDDGTGYDSGYYDDGTGYDNSYDNSYDNGYYDGSYDNSYDYNYDYGYYGY